MCYCLTINVPPIPFSLSLIHDETAVRMSGIDVPLMDQNETAISSVDNGTFLRFSPTSASTSAAASSPGRPGNVYVYVWLFLGLLVFLLTLLVISLHRLKNIISSSSSVPDLSSEGGSSFTNMEICSISSQRSTISALSTWGMWEGAHAAQMHMCSDLCMLMQSQACTHIKSTQWSSTSTLWHTNTKTFCQPQRRWHSGITLHACIFESQWSYNSGGSMQFA